MMQSSPWKFDRTISFGDLIVFIILACSGIGYIIAQDRRQTTLEVQVADIKASDQIDKADLSKHMDRIEDKLDRLIEKGKK